MIKPTESDIGRFVVYIGDYPRGTHTIIEAGRIKSIGAGIVFVAFPKCNCEECSVQGCYPSSLYWLSETVAASSIDLVHHIPGGTTSFAVHGKCGFKNHAADCECDGAGGPR